MANFDTWYTVYGERMPAARLPKPLLPPVDPGLKPLQGRKVGIYWEVSQVARASHSGTRGMRDVLVFHNHAYRRPLSFFLFSGGERRAARAEVLRPGSRTRHA